MRLTNDRPHKGQFNSGHDNKGGNTQKVRKKILWLYFLLLPSSLAGGEASSRFKSETLLDKALPRCPCVPACLRSHFTTQHAVGPEYDS